mgnify:CR=1 FL=1
MAYNPVDYLKNLVPEDTTIFGASPSPNLKRMAQLGLLNGNYEDIVADATKRSNFSGLLNTALSYVSQPKNQGYGSIVPYLAKAGVAGVNAGQKVFDQLGTDAMTNATLEDMKAKRIAANKKDSPFAKPNVLNSTGESKIAWKNSITPENPDGDITLLRKIPSSDTDTRTTFTKLINARDNLNPKSPNYEANYQFYTDKIEKETSFAPPLVDMSSTQETSYAKKYGEGQGTQFFKDDQAFVESGPRAVKQFSKTNMALNLSTKPGRKEGFIANIKLIAEKANVAFGGTPTQAQLDSIIDTELLDATLGSDVFPLIGELNIGARGIDTPAERDFLQKSFTGTIAMNEQTLTKMTALRNKYELTKLQDFNEGVKNPRFSNTGEYGRDVKPMKYKFEPIVIMNPTTTDLMYKNENQIKLNDDGATVTVNAYGEEGNEVYIDTQGYVWGKGENDSMNKLGPLKDLGVQF